MISIVIPNYFIGKSGTIIKEGDEELWFAKNCVERIKKFTDVPYELIMVNDGSNNQEAVDWMKSVADVYVENSENKGFGYTCNRGFEKAKGEYVVCMNNDLFVYEGWASKMIEDYNKKFNMGVLFPDNHVLAYNPTEALELNPDTNNIMKPGVWGAMWMMKKDLMDLIKKEDGFIFDEEFGMGYYEDSDLWDRVKKLTFSLWITGRVKVYHQANITTGHLNSNEHMIKNLELYNKKKSLRNK